MVYVMLADGFEEVEAIEPIDILKRGGVDVTTVGVKSKTVTGAHGIEVTADIEINGVEPEKMELLMLPGGIGHEILDASNDVHGLLNYAVFMYRQFVPHRQFWVRKCYLRIKKRLVSRVTKSIFTVQT